VPSARARGHVLDRVFWPDEFGPLGICATAGSSWTRACPRTAPCHLPPHPRRPVLPRLLLRSRRHRLGINRRKKGAGNTTATLRSIRADRAPIYVLLDNLLAHTESITPNGRQRSNRDHPTARAVEQHLRCHAYPVWEGRMLGGIKPGDVQKWVTGLTATHHLAASTARTVYNTVNAVFSAAVRDRMIPRNPCTGVKLPAVPRKRVVPLSVAQVRNLADQIAPPYKALVLLAAGTGYALARCSGCSCGTWICRTQPSRSTSRSNRQSTGCSWGHPKPTARTGSCRCRGWRRRP
jgi:hypothetical protein